MVPNKYGYTCIKLDSTPELNRKSKEALAAIKNSILLAIELHGFPDMPRLVRSFDVMLSDWIMLFSLSPKETISYLKSLLTWYVWHIRGMVGVPPQVPYYITSNGESVHLAPILSYFSHWEDRMTLAQRTLFLQLVVCALNIHRVVQVRSDKKVGGILVDLGSVVKPTLSKRDLRVVRLIPHALKMLGITPQGFKSVLGRETQEFTPYVISSSGPNGPAMWSGYKDAAAISMYPFLYRSLREYYKVFTKGTMSEAWTMDPWFTLYKKLRRAASAAKRMYSKAALNSFSTGRLHAIPELGGKVRVVAIVDYWSQMTLSPLHNTITHFLERIPMDGTFDQEKVAGRVADWVKSAKPVWSYDLSAATDRLPRWIQKQILTHLVSREFSNAWSNVMTNRQFDVPRGSTILGLHPDAVQNCVSYAVGQPMGAKSSFPMLALTHHVIVQVAYLMDLEDKFGKIPGIPNIVEETLDGVPVGYLTHDNPDPEYEWPGLKAGVQLSEPFPSYVVLGDDNTLAEAGVAKHYHSLVTGILGMDISLAKSFTPIPGAEGAGEICKRIYFRDIELTALNPKVISKAYFQPALAPDLQNVLYRSGDVIHPLVFFKFILAVCGLRGFRFLVRLNLAPESVSGLKRRITPSFLPQASLSAIYGVTEEQLEQCNLFTSLVAQLRRVDALVRATQAISDAMTHNVIQAHMDIGSPETVFVSKPGRAALLDSLPMTGDPHPISIAAPWEYSRVMRHVSEMRADPNQFIARVKAGSLDMLRNTLFTVWTDESLRAEPTSVNRTLFNNTISNLEKILLSSNKALHFELFLAAVGQIWVIHWELGKDVIVSPHKMHFSKSIKALEKRFSEATQSLFARGLRT